jgi:hypothetical protein
MLEDAHRRWADVNNLRVAIGEVAILVKTARKQCRRDTSVTGVHAFLWSFPIKCNENSHLVAGDTRYQAAVVNSTSGASLPLKNRHRTRQ